MTVMQGECVVVCGSSGSGKSTLLRCISGLEEYQKGCIVVNGVNLKGDRKKRKDIHRHVGIVFQQFNLFPHLSVYRNCTLALLWVRRLSKQEAHNLTMHHLAQVHMVDHVNKYPHQLSGGQQQRAAIARTLCMEPKIILFDEPTSSLDPEMAKEVLGTIINLAKGGVTIICVTHEMGFASSIADAVVFIEEGAIVENRKTEDFFQNPQTTRAKLFLG
jgi:general L-amino acid transport system ATP-binding protein